MPQKDVFDGFCHRPYCEETDGWMNEGPSASQYPSVSAAQNVLDLYHDLKAVMQENWRLRQEIKRLRSMCGLSVEEEDNVSKDG